MNMFIVIVMAYILVGIFVIGALHIWLNRIKLDKDFSFIDVVLWPMYFRNTYIAYKTGSVLKLYLLSMYSQDGRWEASFVINEHNQFGRVMKVEDMWYYTFPVNPNRTTKYTYGADAGPIPTTFFVNGNVVNREVWISSVEALGGPGIAIAKQVKSFDRVKPLATCFKA